MNVDVTAPWDGGTWTEVASAQGVLGELVLRERPTDAGVLTELVCNGVQVMDDADAQSEVALATQALDALDPAYPTDPTDSGAARSPHVVVGGLGMAFTVRALLDDDRVGPDARITVVEIEPDVVAWNRSGLVPATAGTLDDARVEVVVGDVAAVLADMAEGTGTADDAQAGQVAAAGADAVLLDVDNGPGFLVADSNAGLYARAGLAAAAAPLRTGGVLAVWSAQAAPQLTTALRDAVGPAHVRRTRVVRDGRDLSYWVHLAHRR